MSLSCTKFVCHSILVASGLPMSLLQIKCFRDTTQMLPKLSALPENPEPSRLASAKPSLMMPYPMAPERGKKMEKKAFEKGAG